MVIYNHHVKYSFAAYSEKDVNVEFFINMKKEAISFYVLEIEKNIVGFAVLRNYLPHENFRHTGKLTYFILPKYTNQGYGTMLYNELIEDAKKNKISKLFIHLSSLNEQSYNFHKKHGFFECGRFRNIAKKYDKYFDIIWMQKNL